MKRTALAATLLLLMLAVPVQAQDRAACLEITYDEDRLSTSDLLDEAAVIRALRRGWLDVDRMFRCDHEPAPRPTPKPQAMAPWNGDATLTYRWLTPDEFDCQYADYCWGMLAHTTAGCPGNLYVELQLLDEGRTVIGFTNETSGALLAGQDARLIFETFDHASAVRPTEMNCY